MPIEIKELNIRINVEDGNKIQASPEVTEQQLKQMKAEIIKICTRQVLQIIKEKRER